jgi:hypothetical protein
MPQEITDLLERRAAREVVDVVPVVGEHPTVAVQVTDGRRGGDDIFETGFGFGVD